MRYPAFCLALCWTLPALAFQPTDHYDKRTIEGWTVYINQDLLADKPLADRCTALLQVKLYDLQRVVPPVAVTRLKEIPIWMELDDKLFPGACYHPSRDWLKTHDVNPDKTGAVEIGNAKHFLTWSIDQPCMVLHEMAHAYHHRMLGFDNPKVKAAYQAAKASGKYDKVLRISGHTERHYAMNNPQEYFAESSEAYFGTNDFYPFVRAELKQVDPAMYDLLKNAWSDAVADPAQSKARP